MYPDVSRCILYHSTYTHANAYASLWIFYETIRFNVDSYQLRRVHSGRLNGSSPVIICICRIIRRLFWVRKCLLLNFFERVVSCESFSIISKRPVFGSIMRYFFSNGGNWNAHKYQFQLLFFSDMVIGLSCRACSFFPSSETRIMYALFPTRSEIKDQFPLGYINSYKEIRRVFSSLRDPFRQTKDLTKKFNERKKCIRSIQFLRNVMRNLTISLIANNGILLALFFRFFARVN